jgi:hypothetical protein
MVRARAIDAAGRVSMAVAVVLCVALAAMFFVLAGLVGLAQVIGFPLAALVFAALFAVMALALWMIGRVLASRRSARIAITQTRATADLALAAVLVRSARPALPLVAFLAAFALARRR